MVDKAGRWLGAIVVALCLTSGSAFGKILKQVTWDCGDGTKGTWTLFKDDCTGQLSSFMVTCTGKTYANVPMPEFGRSLSGNEAIALPSNFIDMLQTADLSTAGGYSGVWFTADGEKVYLMNPATEEEYNAILEGWECEMNGGLLD